MVQYPYVVLPDYFTQLLRMNLHRQFSSLNDFQSYVVSYPPLNALFHQMFKDIDPKLRFEAIFKSLGWTGFRNRVASGFVLKLINGEYPETANQDVVSDIVSLETVLQSSSVEGHNRAFLYGFYLKVGRLVQGSDENTVGAGHKNLLSPAVLECLKLLSSRVINIDHLIIVLEHFVQYMGEEQCLDYLKQGLQYAEMTDKCTREQQRELAGNLLNYGASINESDFLSGSYVG